MNVDSKDVSLRQKGALLMSSLVAGLAINSPAFAADLATSTKDFGSTVITYLIIATIVVGSSFGLVAILSMTTGISWLSQQGQKKLLVALGGIAGVLLFSTLVSFIIKTATSTGGGFAWSWGF
ncbi:hypothetical protein WOSG25_070450 [Weissella oryzae SG25]|uniref:Uncharacterized protein n=1 Tax=Weissella oryzae (strain DSM 25784 / JCM 18191 / LMG 30913 / SG25) TaxID=1329250 RepID=A0A069CUZ7_WEIOS|nr:hypothetical protein [Weissella oryzae]GAK31068.1 hypothetical protein WOSG25_070450 [Weissella oryzae SG25]